MCWFVVAQIRDEMKTFVLAGHETSASMLNWSLFELMENSDLMSKVRIAVVGWVVACRVLSGVSCAGCHV